MKIVVNRTYGGMSEEHKALRTNPDFVKEVEKGYDGDINKGTFANGFRFERLGIVEIPDESTDFYIEDYDGLEAVLYVVDGKIHKIEPDLYED